MMSDTSPESQNWPAAPATTEDEQPQSKERPVLASQARLKSEHILRAEFDYAGQAALQAVAQRTTTLNLCYVLAGVYVAAFGALHQLRSSSHSDPVQAMIVLLLSASILSSGFILRFIRLRRIYRDSIASMIQVKDFYIQNAQQEHAPIDAAFRWTKDSLSDIERLNMANVFVCHVLAVLASATAGLAVYFGVENWHGASPASALSYLASVAPWMVALAVGLVWLACHVFWYWFSLKRDSSTTAISK